MSDDNVTAEGAKEPGKRILALGNPGFFLLASLLCAGVSMYCISGPRGLFVPLLGGAALSCVFCGTGLAVGFLRWRRLSHLAQWLTMALLIWGLILVALIAPAM